jgi:hypothetical protein
VFQLREEKKRNPENEKTAEAISQRREQFTKKVSVMQPHVAEIKRGVTFLPIELMFGFFDFENRCG